MSRTKMHFAALKVKVVWPAIGIPQLRNRGAIWHLLINMTFAISVFATGTHAPAQPAAAPATQPLPSLQGPVQAPGFAPSITVGQRAALLIEAPDEPKRVRTWYGSVVWKLETSTGGLPVLRADVDIAEARLTASIMMTRNGASEAHDLHIITVRFTPGADSPVPGVAEIEPPSVRMEERPVGDPLEARAVLVTANYFMVGMLRGSAATTRNLSLLKSRNWIDVPMRLITGKIAKITFEKGPVGEKLLAEFLDASSQNVLTSKPQSAAAPPIGGTLPPSISGAPPSPIRQLPISRVVPSGEERVLEFWTSLFPDCTSRGPIVARVLIPPEHGVMSVVPNRSFASEPANSPLATCNSQQVPGIAIRYKSENGFSGDDNARVLVIYPDGFATESEVTILVR